MKILALDFGGTKHAAGLLNLGEKQWLAHNRALSPPAPNFKTDMDVMRSRSVPEAYRLSTTSCKARNPLPSVSASVAQSMLQRVR